MVNSSNPKFPLEGTLMLHSIFEVIASLVVMGIVLVRSMADDFNSMSPMERGFFLTCILLLVLNARIGGLHDRFDKIDGRFEKFKGRLRDVQDKIDARLDKIEDQLQDVQDKQDEQDEQRAA
jgi:hypothetical protein